MSAELELLLKNASRTALPNVLLASAECAPLSKTGGLADVVGTLPKALKKHGCETRVITPYHKVIKDKYSDSAKHLCDFKITLGWRNAYVGIEYLEIDGVKVYLVDNEQYFGSKIYLGGREEGEQYAFFTRAVLEALPMLDFIPEVIHCNDWHTAMIPMLARTQYSGKMQQKLKFLLTIHNIAFQGRYDFGFFQDLLNVDPMYYTPEFFELYGCADFLKGGCVFADRINTVSPTYAGEIRTPYYAEQLEGILNARCDRLSGIINGIDVDVFNPEDDKAIAACYTKDRLSGKCVCKAALQEEMELKVSPDVPLFSMVTRMTEQKGFDLISEFIDSLLNETEAQFVVLGSGDERFEEFIKGCKDKYKGRVGCFIGYNEQLSHRVYAGSDFYLMPSRFEPCGLSQLIAMRYGTLPIVRETGGLKDTVKPYDRMTGEGTGFSFKNYDSRKLRNAVNIALDCWNKKDVMDKLIKNAMSEDFSFDKSALEYMKLYLDIV